MRCENCFRELEGDGPCAFCAETLATEIEGPRESYGGASLGSTRAYPHRHRVATAGLGTGTLLADRYELVERIGAGGMGEVYRAHDHVFDQAVAVKFLPSARVESDHALQQFREEARLARQVSHPNVCRIHDYGHTDGLGFVTMEYIEGEDLSSLRKRVGRLPVERAVELGIEICAGLGAIHDRGILHRDLKPANVMLDHEGRARILDFGLAAMADSVRGTDVRSGTPAYMAPEQAGGREVSAKSDLYSLGLVLWELLTGEPLRRSERDRPPLLSSRSARVDPAVDRIIRNCLDHRPALRPASAESVTAALRRSLEPEEGVVLRTALVTDLRAEVLLDEVVNGLLEHYGGQVASDTVGPLFLFEHPRDAVGFAMAYRGECFDRGRLGLEVSELRLRPRRPGELGVGSVRVDGGAALLARRLVDLACPGQTLLTSYVCRLARQSGLEEGLEARLSWLSHGRYRLEEDARPVEIFEVGVEGWSPLRAPDGSEATPAVRDGVVLTGWRPAMANRVPHRPSFLLERRLGEGGFGEVWLARHAKTGERRVFKFCFEASRLNGLRREITLFRLLKEELGDRPDIARVLDWNLKAAPFFVESEYSTAGDLIEWADSHGGLERIPLRERLEVVAQVAMALAASHSVGVLHKDVKPSNILVSVGVDGRPRARLADFGIGLATDHRRFEEAGITIMGFTTAGESSADASYGGTRLYTAPEVFEGKTPTLRGDIFALGVVLFQMVVGDFSRALAQGWREAVTDPVLVKDIIDSVHGDPAKRLADAALLAERLRTHPERCRRRQERLEKRQAQRRSRRRRSFYKVGGGLAAVMLVIVSLLAGWALRERERERTARQTAEHAEAAAEQVTDFLIETFDATNPYSISAAAGKQGPGLTARELLDQRVSALDGRFEDEPLIRARVLNQIGRIYRGMGEYEASRPLIEEALGIRQRQLGREDLGTAESLFELGVLDSLTGRPSASLWLRESLEIRRRLRGDTHGEIEAENLYYLGRAAFFRGEFVEAETILEEAMALGDSPGDENIGETVSRLSLLGTVELILGKTDQAGILLARSLDLARQELGQSHLMTARALVSHAFYSDAVGDFRRAEEEFRRALEIRRDLLGDRHPAVGRISSHLGRLLIDMGKSEQALRALDHALEIFAESLPADNAWTVYAEGLRGACLSELGYRTEAEQLLRDAYRTLADGLEKHGLFTRQIVWYLSRFYERSGHPRLAAEYLAIWQATDPSARHEPDPGHGQGREMWASVSRPR